MAKVSILIVNYNGKVLLKKCLDSIRRLADKNYEVIVVDNNSADGSVQFLRSKCKSVKIVQNKKNLGYCGINAGIESCRGKYIFFTNNDISLGKNCLKRLAEALDADESIGIASPKMVNYFNKSLKSCGTWVSRCFYNGHFKCRHDSAKEIPYNGIALIRKSIVNKFGYLFDDDYFVYAEDLDLGLRARLLGYRVVHVPDAVVYHMHSATLKKNKKYKLTYLMERNLLRTFAKIFSVENIMIFLPYVLAMRLIAVLKDILSLNFMNAGARVAAMLNVMVNIRCLAKKRSFIQRLRKMDDNFLLRVFSERYLFSSDKITV